MSVSLYYTAKRKQPLSKQEQEHYQKIVDDYIANYPFGDMYESFCVYDPDTPVGVTEENVIFEGATKLPLDEGEEYFAKVYDYWSDCLQAVIGLLPGARWDIHLDDVDVAPYFDYPKIE